MCCKRPKYTGESQSCSLKIVHCRAARIIYGFSRDMPSHDLLKDCDLWKHLVFQWLLAFFRLVHCRSFKAKDYWTFSHCCHGISFCSCVYMYVHRMQYTHHEVHECDRYNHEFSKTSGYPLKCVLQLVALTSHTKVPSKAPHSTGLSQTSLKTHNYCEQNKTACSTIFTNLIYFCTVSFKVIAFL